MQVKAAFAHYNFNVRDLNVSVAFMKKRWALRYSASTGLRTDGSR